MAPSSYSLAQAQLFRALSGGKDIKIVSSTQLDEDHHALIIRGEWLGQQETRCYLLTRAPGPWHVVQLPNEWVQSAARLLQPLLPGI